MDDKSRNIRHEAIIISKFKLIHCPANDTVELYNIIDDLSDTTDLSSDSFHNKKVSKDLMIEEIKIIIYSTEGIKTVLQLIIRSNEYRRSYEN